MTDTNLAGQTVLITGAGGALGRAAAVALAAQGADLVLADISEEAMGQTLALVPGARAVVADVVDADALATLAQTAREAFGRPVTSLVAAAGIFGRNRKLIDYSEDEYDQMMDLNVRGLWRLAKVIIPQMREAGGGAIVLFSSTAGLQASRDVPLYSISKAAVVMMTRTLALNHADEGIRVNCVCPATIESPMAQGSIAFAHGAEAQAERRARIVAAHPMGRLGLPEEVAKAVVWMLTDASSYTTGAAIPVDGGRLA